MNSFDNRETHVSVAEKIVFVQKTLWSNLYLLVSQCVVVLLVSAWWPLGGLLVKNLLDAASLFVVGKVTMNFLVELTLGTLLVNLLVILLHRLLDVVSYRKDQAVKRVLTINLLRRVLAAPQSFFEDNAVGFLSNKIITMADSLLTITNTLVGFFLTSFLQVCFTIIICYKISMSIGILLLLFVFALLCVARVFVKQMGDLASKTASCWASVAGTVSDVLGNMANVKCFAASEFEIGRMDELCAQAEVAGKAAGWYSFKIYAYLQAMLLLVEAVILLLLLRNFRIGLVTVGDFAFLLNSLMLFFQIFWGLSQNISAVINSWGNVSQVLDTVLSVQPEVCDSGASELVVARGEIVFEKVNFNYKGKKILFQDKSLRIKPYEKLGIVGKPGGGKTTFISLILRLYDVAHGSILIDGQNITEVTRDSLRKAIAIVPQSLSLFQRTFLDNIRYGKHDATDEEVFLAARKAYIHDFISSLPGGYQTLIGEGGLILSAGQRQGMGIARAILKDAPILILDEATQALDLEFEEKVQKSLWEFAHGRTTIVIAHKLTTLQKLDRILVFDEGRIIGQGSHNELLETCSFYRELWAKQTIVLYGENCEKNYEQVSQV
jgi:ATP-binding cassette subfamily B protein